MSSLVSILLPVFNQQDYIKECIKSILDQTHQHFEIIIINDKCTDRSIDIVEAFHDSRIKIFHNSQNLGLAASLNKAVSLANGEFLARMDADDIALPTRIAKQVDFLNAHTDISILGTAMESFGYHRYVHNFPLSHEECKSRLLFNVCFGHPTVMFRKEIFSDPAFRYKEELKQYSEEYDLWCRVVDKTRFANLPEILLQYRTFAPSDKRDAENKRRANSVKIRNEYLTTQLQQRDRLNFNIHDHVCNVDKAQSPEEFYTWLRWLSTIESINKSTHAFSEAELHRELLKWKFEIYYWNTHLGLSNWIRYLRDSDKGPEGLKLQVKLFLKSII